jgi:hypothetical protein
MIPAPELQITLSSPTDVEARAPDGKTVDGQISPNELRRVTVDMFDTLLRKGPVAYRRALEVLGMHLYDMVFSNEVEKLFLGMRSKLAPGEKLRVLLIFRKEALSLAGLPWEYLYGPDTENRLGYYFSTDKDLTFARFLRLDSPRENLAPESSPLRITIISSRPSLLNPILHRPVIEEIKKLPDIELGETIEQPTKGSLLKKLEEFAREERPPHVLHFMGHGQFLGDRGQIALLREDGQTEHWVDDKEFAGYFRQTGCLPRLVVLHLCEGGRVSFPSHFGGIAPQLVMAGVPAVVAMQYPITNQTAIDFSCAFYRHIGRGEPIDHAVQNARYTAMTKITPESGDERVFGAPVLYLQSWDGVIKPPKKASPSTEFGHTKEGVTLGNAPTGISQPFMTEAKAAGFAAADRNQLDIADVSKAIRATPWAATAPEVRRQLVDLLDSANSLEAVWAAMLTAIEKEIAR